MDAQVARLIANDAALTGAVTTLISDFAAIQAQLASGIDAGDEAAISKANDDFEALLAKTSAALPAPAGASGGASGVAASGPAASGASGAPVVGASGAASGGASGST